MQALPRCQGNTFGQLTVAPQALVNAAGDGVLDINRHRQRVMNRHVAYQVGAQERGGVLHAGKFMAQAELRAIDRAQLHTCDLPTAGHDRP